MINMQIYKMCCLFGHMNDVLIANITWNPFGWRNNDYINPLAGHKYAQENVGGESLNFDFYKKGVDRGGRIHGYFRWTNQPVNFKNGGLIIFHTTNTDEKIGQFIGLYGDARLFDYESKKVPFSDDPYYFNVEAAETESLLFPVYLTAESYKQQGGERFAPQGGYTYRDLDFAERVIGNQLQLLQDQEYFGPPYQKLLNVYRKYFGKNYISRSEEEQDAIITEVTSKPQKLLRKKLRNLENTDYEPEVELFSGRRYKRDNVMVAALKVLRNHECQLCGGYIPKRDGGKYVEAAHIKPKHTGSSENADNIMILCPNHHKEFDLGDTKISEHTSKLISFSINGTDYHIDLRI